MFGKEWRETVRLIRMEIPVDKEPIFDFLESEGLRFCVHFGIDNALAVAVAHWNATVHKRTIH
jgi:hypothetical protein